MNDAIPTIKELQAEQIRLLAAWHKKTCHQEDCGINLMLLWDVYKALLGGNASISTLSDFM